MDDSTISVLHKAVGIYSLFLIVFGTLGNILSVVVCLRKELRKVPTFVFYAFTLVHDTISLYFWNLDHYFTAFYGYEIERISFTLCRLFTELQMFSLQSSAWIMVKFF